MIIFYGITPCTTLFSYIMWQHYAPLHMTVFYDYTLCTTSYDYILWQHTMHNFLQLYSMTHTVHHFIWLYSITTHLAPLHTAIFYDIKLYTTSCDYILWEHTMHHFIWLYSVTTYCAPLNMIFLKGGCSLSHKWFYLYIPTQKRNCGQTN
jgi:hypothetical protein